MAKQDEIYRNLIRNGYTEKDAAKEAQKRTGFSMVSGKPIRAKQLKFTSKGISYGQQKSFKKSKGGFGQFNT